MFSFFTERQFSQNKSHHHKPGALGCRSLWHVTFNIVAWPLEFYYSWDQCWDSARPDGGHPVPLRLRAPHSSWMFLRRLLSPNHTPLCWDWVVIMKTKNVHLWVWQSVRDSEENTHGPDTWLRGGCKAWGIKGAKRRAAGGVEVQIIKQK